MLFSSLILDDRKKIYSMEPTGSDLIGSIPHLSDTVKEDCKEPGTSNPSISKYKEQNVRTVRKGGFTCDKLLNLSGLCVYGCRILEHSSGQIRL